MEQQESINAIVTMMGKKILAGRIRETNTFGLRGIAIDVPECDGYGGFTRTVSHQAVYDIQPCTFDDVLDAVFDQQMQALPIWTRKRPVTYPVWVKFDLNGERREAIVLHSTPQEPTWNSLTVALCKQGHADELEDTVRVYSWSEVHTGDPE